MMQYSLQKLATKADCDVLITAVQKEKLNLEYQQTTLLHQEDGIDDEGLGLESELKAIATELQGITGIIATLPDGKSKDGYLKKQAMLTHRQLVLMGKKENYGAVALVQTEFERAQVALQITEASTLLAAIEARKAELAA